MSEFSRRESSIGIYDREVHKDLRASPEATGGSPARDRIETGDLFSANAFPFLYQGDGHPCSSDIQSSGRIK